MAIWTGTWNTNYGRMELRQWGDSVNGTYEAYGKKGELNGKADGPKLKGTWSQAPPDPTKGTGNVGQFEFIISDDSRSFKGSWWPSGGMGTGGPWDGQRS